MSSSAGRALRLVIMGAPGSGKGTISTRLTRALPHLVPISTGTLLRTHIRNATPLGQQAAQLVQSGHLVPDSLINSLVACELADRPSTHLLLDGYPRTVAQAAQLDDWTLVQAVINLDVPRHVILDRVLNRWVHPGSGRTYHSTYSPPKVAGKDDVTGEPLVRRDDDRKEVVEERLNEYDRLTRPLVEYYATKRTPAGKSVLVNVKGNTSDEIFPVVKRVVEDLMAQASGGAKQ
ncbi:adenylate kinase-domain-containing protein [Catenaria anguillulae PL171]|uniref:Adenylate kinase-domain-containing protein n=1 Tax=Catenaria anguillulae PL171 TaxID=765915 RepID=A0A1Y2HTV9_9FUNG|nr:adenylate kinase-domain-containing protein [Catenaria anguillulae PL171]